MKSTTWYISSHGEVLSSNSASTTHHTLLENNNKVNSNQATSELYGGIQLNVSSTQKNRHHPNSYKNTSTTTTTTTITTANRRGRSPGNRVIQSSYISPI